jgi:hypothetical protein
MSKYFTESPIYINKQALFLSYFYIIIQIALKLLNKKRMKKKIYLQRAMNTVLIALIACLTSISALAQEYADSTGLIADLEAGIYEEYILAPASVEDTFFIRDIIYPQKSFILKAKDGLGFKPVVTGNTDDRPSQLFRMAEIVGGADVEFQGIHFVGSIGDDKAVSDGLMRILTEDINLTVIDCEFHDFQGYNTIAKVYNSGGDITLDNVLLVNTGGKIIQVNYKDDDSTPNYVPKMGDLTITNTTSIDNYERIFFELGAGNVPIDENDPDIVQRFNAGVENITIDHCTFFRHDGVNLMQGRSLYEFSGDMTAVEGTFTLTNTIFSAMDENLNPDSASLFIFDYNYYDFGLALDPEDVDDIDALYGATNTVATAPVFADTANGAWDLTLQNEADILGSDGTPIGDPRWWQQEWTPEGFENIVADKDIATVYGYQDRAIIKTSDGLNGAVSVYSVTGQLVRSQELVSERTEIQLPTGLYFVKVSTSKGTMAAKVLCTK